MQTRCKEDILESRVFQRAANQTTVANSSCLIALDAMGRIDLLPRLYAEISAPAAVAQECGGAFSGWVRVHTVQNKPLMDSLKLELGPGEAEAIALCSELSAARLILDDKKARRIARQLSLPVSGTLAVVLAAKGKGLIPAVKDIIDALQAANICVSPSLADEVLRRAED